MCKACRRRPLRYAYPMAMRRAAARDAPRDSRARRVRRSEEIRLIHNIICDVTVYGIVIQREEMRGLPLQSTWVTPSGHVNVALRLGNGILHGILTPVRQSGLRRNYQLHRMSKLAVVKQFASVAVGEDRASCHRD